MLKADAAGGRRLSLITTQNGAETVVNGSSYDTTTGAYVPLVPSLKTITSATTTSIDDAPAANTISDYDFLSVVNTYAGDHPMTLQITSSSGGPFMRKPFTLGQDESMNYAHGTGFQFFDAEGNLKVVETLSTPPVCYPGAVRLTGVSYKRGTLNAGATGDHDIYTVPSGKRAIVFGYTIFNNSGAGIIASYPAIKIGGTYYRMNAAINTNDQATGTFSTQLGYIFEAGETFAINTATNNGANVVSRIAEFDATNGARSVKLLSLANGDNTVYTVPAGYSASLLSNAMCLENSSTALQYVNSSGGSRNISWNLVNSGGSVAASNKITPTSAVADGVRSALGANASLESGDFININTNAATATQIAWVNVLEVPNP